jgi:hypothetical protein
VEFHVGEPPSDLAADAVSSDVSTDMAGAITAPRGAVSGDLRTDHRVTLGFAGPLASESGMTEPGNYRPPSTFADYRLDVTYTHIASTTTMQRTARLRRRHPPRPATIGGFELPSFLPPCC